MKPLIVALAAALTLGACGGDAVFNVDDGSGGGGVTPPDPSIPGGIAGNVTSVSYNAAAQTLTVVGVALDDTPFQAVYTRKPGLDATAPGYEVYTAQDGSLGRHFTAFVQQRDGAFAAVVGSGPQFNTVLKGATYGRTGTYSAPTTAGPGGLVNYAGNYVGVLNAAGSGEDLLAVTPGTDPSILPTQVAEVTGLVFIRADFADNSVDGIIYDRQVEGAGPFVDDLSLVGATINADGTFSGNAMLPNLTNVGQYGGIFGGTNATAVAGGVFVEDHIDTFSNESEHGVFVLAQCGTPAASPVCTQPVP